MARPKKKSTDSYIAWPPPERLNFRALIQVDLARGWRSAAYIYSVILMPVLLIVALLMSRWHSDNTSRLELAAALVAVVPLRQVLVPTEISGFTVLDKILGIEVGAIIVVSIFTYSAVARRHRNGRDTVEKLSDPPRSQGVDLDKELDRLFSLQPDDFYSRRYWSKLDQSSTVSFPRRRRIGEDDQVGGERANDG